MFIAVPESVTNMTNTGAKYVKQASTAGVIVALSSRSWRQPTVRAESYQVP